MGPLQDSQAFAKRSHWCDVQMNMCEDTSPICPTQALLLCMARGEPPGTFILMAATIVLSTAKSPLVILMGIPFHNGLFDRGGSQGPCMGTRGGANHMGTLGRCRSQQPLHCISFAWTYVLAWGTLCYCMLHNCIVGTLDTPEI